MCRVDMSTIADGWVVSYYCESFMTEATLLTRVLVSATLEEQSKELFASVRKSLPHGGFLRTK